MSIRCNDCGHVNGSWQGYCSKCGADLSQQAKGKSENKDVLLRRSLINLAGRAFHRTLTLV